MFAQSLRPGRTNDHIRENFNTHPRVAQWGTRSRVQGPTLPTGPAGLAVPRGQPTPHWGCAPSRTTCWSEPWACTHLSLLSPIGLLVRECCTGRVGLLGLPPLLLTAAQRSHRLSLHFLSVFHTERGDHQCFLPPSSSTLPGPAVLDLIRPEAYFPGSLQCGSVALGRLCEISRVPGKASRVNSEVC